MSNHICLRCGRCCYNGGDMYTLEPPESGKCPYISYDENGLAVCDMQHDKPTVCREYPWEGELCELQKAMNSMEIKQ